MYEVDYRKDGLGRVTIVNQIGQCLYDTFVLPKENCEITDLRSRWSGIEEENLKDATPFEEAQKKVFTIFEQAKVIVGHDLMKDVKVLELDQNEEFSVKFKDTKAIPAF